MKVECMIPLIHATTGMASSANEYRLVLVIDLLDEGERMRRDRSRKSND